MEGAHDLDDGHIAVNERRFRTPVRAPPVKRKNNVHEEEPGTKMIITGEMSDDDSNMKMDELNMINEKRTDEMIVSQAIIGKNLHDVYSNERIILAVNRQSVENMNAQMASVDVMEVFSPERVGKACKLFGLEQGLAMDIKSGYDFDLAADRAKCSAAVERDKPTLVIGSPPCTLFSRFQELNKHMYKDSPDWMAKFQHPM